MRKKRLRDGECESDESLGREDSSNEAKQGNGDIIAVESVSSTSGDSASEDEFKMATKLQAAPFSIGSQKGHNTRGKRILQGIQKILAIHHQEADNWLQAHSL